MVVMSAPAAHGLEAGLGRGWAGSTNPWALAVGQVMWSSHRARGDGHVQVQQALLIGFGPARTFGSL